MSGIFGEEYILGSFLSRLLPILFALTVFTFQNNNKIVYPLSLLLIATDVLIYISGERLGILLCYFNNYTFYMFNFKMEKN